MKSLTLAVALGLAPIAFVSAEGCMDIDSSTSPSTESVSGSSIDIARSSNKGNLYVKLNNTSNLRDKDIFGKSDLCRDSYKARSEDVKSNLNPVYNQTFCFYVRPGQSALYVSAVDKDTFRNDKIGQTLIPWPMSSGLDARNMQMQFVEDTSP
ncbi:hypothetical protein BGW39_001363 [Mortierella sp. 14UC]|nr:hypothetical protein BGW39_001363 [Mortierella sp. 14UC]